MARIDPAARVRNHVAELLADGPMTFDALLEALLDEGLELGPEPDDRLDGVLETMPRIGGVHVADEDHPLAHADLVFDPLALIDGTTWTVPVGPVELASDTFTPDALGLLFLPLVSGWCTVDGGGEVDIDVDGRRAEAAAAAGAEPRVGVAFPAGWLAAHGAVAGGWLQLRVDGDVVHGSAVEAPPAPTLAQIDALSDIVLAGEIDRASGLGDVLAELLVLHPELRDVPVPPIGEWIAAAGLAQLGSRVAPGGFDFEQEGIDDEIDDAVERLGLRDQDAEAYRVLAAALAAWEADGAVEPVSLAAAARSLGSLAVVDAFVDEVCDRYGDDDDPTLLEDLGRFGEALIEVGRGTEQASAAWIVARSLAAAGQTDRFEDWIDVALGFDDGHPLALWDQAWFAFDRGDARRAKALLSRFSPDLVAHDLAILDEVLAPRRPAAGRNDPCPCGSGRKYKRCHLGKDDVSLDARLTWLYRKANWWLGVRHRRQVEAMAWVRARQSLVPPDRLLDDEPLIADAVLCEGGRFQQWLDERGSLLPDDEALLAAQWALVERSVFEVTDVRLDEGMTLRDVRTGDRIDVQERMGTHGLRVGWYVLARPLPTGTGGHQLFGGLTIVPDSALDRFLEVLDHQPTPVRLLGAVADLDAPPTLTTTDGQAMVFCETTWEVVDPHTASARLDDRFEPGDDPGTWTWLADGAADAVEDGDGSDDEEPFEIEAFAGGRTVLASLVLDGDLLVARTQSEERADAVAAIIAELLPGAALVEALRSDIEELRDDLAYEELVFGDDDPDGDDDDGFGGPGGSFDPADLSPELAAVVRAQMDRYEEQWVDESIPALGGATPRQALDDPTRRDDLFRLLDRMDEQDDRLPPEQRQLGMRPDRLRELLGLPPRQSELRLPGL